MIATIQEGQQANSSSCISMDRCENFVWTLQKHHIHTSYEMAERTPKSIHLKGVLQSHKQHKHPTHQQKDQITDLLQPFGVALVQQVSCLLP